MIWLYLIVIIPAIVLAVVFLLAWILYYLSTPKQPEAHPEDAQYDKGNFP